jgi:predicted ATP-grasp superfamily ATP-dependent carboligase
MKVLVLCQDLRLGQVILDCLSANRADSWIIYDNDVAWALRYTRRSKIALVVQGGLLRHHVRIVKTINELHAREHFDMVLATDVHGELLLADHRDQIEPAIYPVASRPVLELLNDKWQFYLFCRNFELPVPKTLHAPDVTAAEREIGFPAVIKPIDWCGGQGISIVQNSDELRHAFSEFGDAEFIVQEFVQGEDVCVSLFARDGVTEAIATYRCGIRFRTTFDWMPSFAATCEKIVGAVGYTGVANFDARITPEEDLRLIECNPRFFARLSEVRIAGMDFIRMGFPGAKPVVNKPAGVVFGRGDPAGLKQIFRDKMTARYMIRSWYEYVSDPGPKLAAKLHPPVLYRRERVR